MMEHEHKNYFEHDNAHNVEATEVRLFPRQVLLKLEQEGGQLFLPISIHQVFCLKYVM